MCYVMILARIKSEGNQKADTGHKGKYNEGMETLINLLKVVTEAGRATQSNSSWLESR